MAAHRPLLLAFAALCCLAAANADVFSAAADAESDGSHHDIIFGSCHRHYDVLHSERVTRSSKILRVVTAVVAYPDEPGEQGGLIKCIRLQPLKSHNVGTARIQRGGPGHHKVSIEFKSDRGHSLAWNVGIYGRY